MKETKRVLVILCKCGGYHSKANCPVAWAEFNRWYDEGLAKAVKAGQQ